MTASSIKITALNNIGANISFTSLVPIVNVAGNAITDNSNVQNLGNYILNSAGGSYFPPAAQAVLAQTVTNAAQPNITSVGTLTSANIIGNLSAGNVAGGNYVIANFFAGDGRYLTNVNATSTYSNANVASYLPVYTGSLSASNITAPNITANTGIFTGNGSGLSALTGANVTGTVANATYSATTGTVTIAAQPNITSVGTLTSLAVTGNIVSSNSNISSVNVLSTTSIITGPSTISSLPVNPSDGQRAYVTNALSPVWGSAVAAGGSRHVPVYYDGSNSAWYVG